MEKTPKVSVIIPVYNDPERLRLCLQALDAQSYPKDAYEVIVIDNGSDEPVETVADIFPRVSVAREAAPGSYAARNTGIALAKGDILAFTDSDCIPAPNWIERGVTALRHCPECGIVGGKLEPAFQNPAHPTAVELYEVIMYYCQERFIEAMHFSVTANLFTWKRVVDHVGVFNPQLKSGGDREWGQRVHSSGYSLMYADDLRVVHPARNSYQQLAHKVKRVAGGVEALNTTRESAERKDTLEFLRSLVPPVMSVIRFKRAHPVDRKEQLTVILLWFWLKFLEIREYWRMRAGGKPLR